MYRPRERNGLDGYQRCPLYGQRVGERLRVTLDGEKMTGTVSATSQNGFDLRPWGGKSCSVMHSEIDLLERSLGTQTYKKRGFTIGFGAGTLGGLFLSFLVVDTPCNPNPGGCEGINAEEAILASTPCRVDIPDSAPQHGILPRVIYRLDDAISLSKSRTNISLH